MEILPIPVQQWLDKRTRIDELILRQTDIQAKLLERLISIIGQQPAGLSLDREQTKRDYYGPQAKKTPYEMLGGPNGIDLTTGQTDKEYHIEGDAITAATDGTLDGIYVKLNDKEKSQPIPIKYFNPFTSPVGFNYLYLTWAAQPGKRLYMLIGREAGALPLQTAGPIEEYLYESAVRLGSIDMFDRRGKVMLAEGFESGIGHLDTAIGGLGAAVASDATYFKSGAKSCKLTGGSANPWYALVSLWTPYPPLSRLGGEASFAFSNMDAFQLITYYYDGTNLNQGAIRYDHTNGRLEYYDSAGAWQILATRSLKTGLYVWHTMKVVIDPSTTKFVRAIFDYDQYDLSAKALYSAANATLPAYTAEARCISRNGQNDVVYVDNMIATRNEP
jgi:hypothetical protein